VVSGASGVGKTSLLAAGVLPRQRRDGLPGDSAARGWPYLLFTPGARPLDELAAQLAVLAEISVEEARRSLAASPHVLGRLARQAVLTQARHRDTTRVRIRPRQRLVLVVDQFEDVFRRCDSEDERRTFIAALASAAAEPESSVLVVLVVRSDYEQHCGEYPQLAAAVWNRYRLGPMTQQELELAIARPARRAGVTVERELVDRLVTEARRGVGALPWVSYALEQAWDIRMGDALTLAAYAAGDIEAVLSARAQMAYHSFTESQRDTVRRVFLQLVATRQDGGDGLLLSSLGALNEQIGAPELRSLLGVLADKRIVTLAGEGAEISHPALLTGWQLLRDWLADRHRHEPAASRPMRVLIDIVERQGDPYLIVSGPGDLRSERPVSWVGSTGRRLLVALQAARSVTEPEVLADAVDQGHASEEQLVRYGQLLFDAAFSSDFWHRLRQTAAGHRSLELAIWGAGTPKHAALQALRWEALHDHRGVPVVRGGIRRDGPPLITIVRTMPGAGQLSGASARADFQPIRHLPRVLFTGDARLDGPRAQADSVIASTMRELENHGVAIHQRVLESATLTAIRREVGAFRPDVLHLITYGQRSAYGRLAIVTLRERGWLFRQVTPEELLDAFREAGHAPRIVVLTAWQNASAPDPRTDGSAQDRDGVLPVAARLVAGGIPVVVAMAGQIGVTESNSFTKELIALVLRGVPLDEAIARGRQLMFTEAEPSATQWALPTVFLAEHVRGDLPLVDIEVLKAVGERINRLGLAQEPLAFVRNKISTAMDRLLDGGDWLSVLVGLLPDQRSAAHDLQLVRSAGHDLRLVRELGAHAVRAGVLPVMLGIDRDPPTTYDQLVSDVYAAIYSVRSSLGLGMMAHERLEVAGQAVDVNEPFLPSRIRMEFTILTELDLLVQDLRHALADLPEGDPLRARAASEPKVMLLCHGVDRWQGSFEFLLRMMGDGPMRLGGVQKPIPVVVTGANAGALRDALLGPWHDQPWLTAMPLDRPDHADPADGDADEIRALVAARDFQRAQERLARLEREDPEQAEPLRLEFGFITLPDPDRWIVATTWSATAAGRSVRSLLAGDDAQSRPVGDGQPSPGDNPPDAAEATAPAADADPATRPTPAATQPRRPPQESGAALEQATVDLFARFFAVDPEAILSRLRRQGSGLQFGHDIELECAVAGSPTVRCHVECKNLDRPVTLDDIAPKLAQQKYHHRGAKIDHWILISPRHNVANELAGMLEAWDADGEYPFSVQVWSPETRVREMFALEPAVYAAVYGQPPTQEEVDGSAEAAGLIRQRLAPRLHVDEVWRRYLRQPRAFCFVNEEARHFDKLYGHHLPLKAADERGAPLDRTLLEQVTGWANDPAAAPMLLLADFGEGKSVFTYCLTRRLAEEYRAAPDGALFPLRIPLREFREAGSARGLLERRLAEVGATLAQWRSLTDQVRTLAILDGFDEMSADLSPAAITANLRDIRSCLTELSGSKVLVTSRQRVLDGSRDWKRTLDRLGRPQVMRIASGPRRQRVRYLEQFATDEASARVLANLRSLYDPIGLAAKPLFLEMIKETLKDLPADTFSETILYETYIRKSLETKWELLADPGDELTSDELIENLKDILEDVAVRLQEVNGAYLYLRDYQGSAYQNKGHGKIAELLWKMRDQAASREPFPLAAQDDAANRVGIRSLLKAVPAPHPERWPVDFFHRSMREYFVARAIVHSLATDAEQARQIMGAAPLLPEIAHFASSILRSRQDDTALAVLERLARSATTGNADAYLGGNAITLLHGAGGLLAERDWSRLILDHARLRGADLHGARLAGSSLRYANLDNANLEDADLTGADLEGVRLEETSQVLAVAAVGPNWVVAAYEDRSLRQWRVRPGAGWESQVVATLDHKAERLQITPLGRVVASGEGMLSVLEMAGGTDDPGNYHAAGWAGGNPEPSTVCCTFRTGSRCRAVVLGGARTGLFAEEGDGGRSLVTWVDMVTARGLVEREVDESITAWAKLDDVLFAFATPDEVQVVWLRGEPKAVIVPDPAVSCLAVRADGNGAVLAAGHHDGSVSLTRLSPRDTAVAGPQWTHHVHDGPVTDICFDAEEQVITGSTDRTVCVIPVPAIRSGSSGRDGDHADGDHSLQRLHLTLRCQGVRFDGVRTEREQEKLRRYAESSATR
jgi:hypothetical protein